MTQTDLDVGPIDYLAVEFPGAKLTGEALAALVDLTDRGIIRVLDLRVAVVTEDGLHRGRAHRPRRRRRARPGRLLGGRVGPPGR